MPSLFGRKRAKESSSSATESGFLSPVKQRSASGNATGRQPPPSPNAVSLRRTFSSPESPRYNSFGEVLSNDKETSIELKYGYWVLHTERTLDISRVAEIVAVCGAQIKARGMELPLLFSTRALDISSTHIGNLIQAYASQKEIFLRTITYANPHDIVGFIKWSLGRLTNNQGKHGFLSFEVYEKWRVAERETGYQPNFLSMHLIGRLPGSTANLLSGLLDLFSSAIAFTSANGTTPRKLAGLFSSFVFGLAEEETFESTFANYVRHTNALEHLILAYVRGQRDQIGQLPTKLAQFVKAYPADLPGNVNTVMRNDVKLREVVRIARTVRFYSSDLIMAGLKWDVPRSKHWSSLYPLPKDPTLSLSGSTLVNSDPSFTPSYKHLLNIQPGNGNDQDEDEDLSMYQKYKSTTDKQWASFMHEGFAAEDKEKLQFDLRESERQDRRLRHATMDWSAFQSGGFNGRETYLDTDLNFDNLLETSVESFPDEQKRMANKLRKLEKSLPDFTYDNIPREERPILVDELFFEAWADVLVCSGWLKEDLKECNWVLCQFRTRPASQQPASPTGPTDGRTEETWFLLEETMPSEYRNAATEGKTKSKTTSFLRTVTRRKPKLPKESEFTVLRPSSNNNLSRSMPVSASEPILSPFKPGPGETKYMSLKHERVTHLTPFTSPAPSRNASLRTFDVSQNHRQYQPNSSPIGEEDASRRSPNSDASSVRESGLFKSMQQMHLSPRRSRASDPESSTRANEDIEAHSVAGSTSTTNESPIDEFGMTKASNKHDQDDDAWVDVMVNSNRRGDQQRFERTAQHYHRSTPSDATTIGPSSVVGVRGSVPLVQVLEASPARKSSLPPLPPSLDVSHSLRNPSQRDDSDDEPGSPYDGIDDDEEEKVQRGLPDTEENGELWRGSRYDDSGVGETQDQDAHYNLPEPVGYADARRSVHDAEDVQEQLPLTPTKSHSNDIRDSSVSERSLRVSKLVEMYSRNNKSSGIPIARERTPPPVSKS